MPGGGPHPKDAELFAADQLPALRQAALELRFLRERGYALPPALKLVGDRHQLRDRQRTAIKRATSQAAGAAARALRRLGPDAAPPAAIWADGFNVVITCETALNGGVLVTTVDHGLRDLAGVHGSYRLSEATDGALELLCAGLAQRGWSDVPVRWLLDAPVSNTGRLAARIRALGEARGAPWTVEVVPDPDLVLAEAGEAAAVATGDSVVLDRCGPWFDWAAESIQQRCPQAWIVELDP